jgi:hypothetical protein
LTLFDYPDPNITSEQRSITNVPLQGLFFMNSDLVNSQADALAARLLQEGSSDEDRIQRAYRIVLERPATPAEVQRGLQFLSKADVKFKRAQAEPATPAVPVPRAAARTVDADDDAPPPPPPSAPATKITPWQQFSQALLSSGEFYYVN